MDIDYEDRYKRALAQIADLREDLSIANAKLKGDEVTVGMARESKIDRQRKALRNLNRRVRVQRLQLRRLNELERGLRPEEWKALKEEFAHELEPEDWEI